jgi:hypothetical protein
MRHKNPTFFMLLCTPGHLLAGIAAAALVAVSAAQATTADRIAAGKSLAMERSKGN